MDRLGRRVYNEGLSYNQRGEFHVKRVVDIDGESVVVDDVETSQLYLVYGPGAHATYTLICPRTAKRLGRPCSGGGCVAGR